ncbi:MAG: ORF6N domain-containing protein [Bacteroidales bacterium]|nr:ORF6N domain-containing protein [Bacteroidales bacterium]
MSENNEIAIPEEVIMSRIYLIRDKKVMLDSDLSELYEVETKQLKRAVRRNIKRFPSDFMFELTDKEFANLRSQFGTSNWGGVRYAPMAFTEQGVAMLSSVLNSERAIAVNIQIIRIFTKMRELLSTHKEILLKLEQLEKKDIEQDDKIMLIFEYLKQLEKAKQQESEQKNRSKIGFKPPKEE